MSTTTIRVPRELHDRLTRHATDEGTTLAGAIERALDAEEDAAFWDEARATMGATLAQTTLRGDTEALSGTLTDGLDPDENWDDVL
ncbi:hypothetical protein CLV30_12083 [Haloactinopolyspora alba]|uniref:Uncharacterized protein n=1 Tax=Haloactinopolyspora alba TaxID=648780 RepID=A0A2P8DM77_9ACTN|nr:hypothetical protein [Haloactinopolyspora alba]PSK98297.1 hypothetical protein CLV30_12083 [Haloactinopolyspora alba]